jgi:hypothetical protein
VQRSAKGSEATTPATPVRSRRPSSKSNSELNNERRQAVLGIIDEMARLDERLNKFFARDETSNISIQHKRIRLSGALNSVAIFISNVIGRECGAWFFELAEGLNDLNIGTTPSLLRAFKANSRTVDSTSIWCQRAIVAAMVFALKNRTGGLAWNCAAQQVADNYPEIAQLAGKKAKDLPTAIYNWHKEFSAKRIKNEVALMVYEEHIRALEERYEKQAPAG